MHIAEKTLIVWFWSTHSKMQRADWNTALYVSKCIKRHLQKLENERSLQYKMKNLTKMQTNDLKFNRESRK